MFGIGMPEMLLLLAVALIVFGPKKLPELAKSLGRAMGEFKRATTDLKDSIESETGISDVRDSIKDVADDINTTSNMAGDVPDPAPVEAAESAPQTDEGAAPLKDVKTEFDKLNADQDESAEISGAGDPDPAEQQDTNPRDDQSK